MTTEDILRKHLSRPSGTFHPTVNGKPYGEAIRDAAAEIDAQRHQHVEGGEDCPTCGQRVPLTRKEMLNKHKVAMLKRAAVHVIDRFNAGEEDANDFMVRDFTEPEDFKRYNFFSHLRLHGLIFKQTDAAGNVLRGRWGITRNGWAFLKGQLQLPAYVLIKNNHIESRADELVNFGQVWRGEDTVQTSFEYFDDDGKPVGVFPQAPAPADNNQGRLL